MDNNRLERLEDKVDAVKEEVSDLRADMRVHMATIERHVSSDERIIEKIAPLLDKFDDIVKVTEDHKFKKKVKADRVASISLWTKRLGLVSVIIGIAVGISRLV